MDSWSHSKILPYIVAVVAAVGLGVLRSLLSGILGESILILPFMLVVVLAAWMGGLGPGLVATAVSVLYANLLLMPPYYTLYTNDLRFGMALVCFIFCGAAISWVCELMHNSRQQVEASREQLSVTLASIGDAVVTTDDRGVIRFINDRAEHMLGRSLADVRDQPFADTVQLLDSVSRRPVDDPTVEAMAKCQEIRFRNTSLLVTQNGHERPIEMTAAPIRNDLGKSVGCVLVLRDISDRLRAEAALLTSERRFRLMADAAPVLIWISGIDKLCTWFNRSWLEYVGRTMDQELGNGWAENVHPEDFDRCLNTYSSAFDARQPFHMEYRMRRHDGDYRWLIDHGIPHYEPDGTFSGYIGSCVDINDLKQVEETLREEDRRKDEFLALLAHELRNPLAPLRNGLELLGMAGLHGDVADQARGMMERQLQHLIRLVDDLLDVSRITRGKIELRRERLPLDGVVQQAVEMCEPAMRQKYHRLTVTLPDEPIIVDIDRIRIAQAIGNLLSNAAKFSDPESEIDLSVGQDGDSAIIRVKDNGIGIPPDMLDHVFELFRQIDQSLEKSQGGLGIGLSIVRRLVELHGGEVAVRSAGRGHGSEFEIRLPLADSSSASDSPAERDGNTTASNSTSGQRRVLIVDDNRDAALSLAMMLRHRGNTVQTAFDGLAGVETYETFQPDLVLLDLGMPRLNGFEACRRMRKLPGGADRVIVALTGWSQEEDRRKSLDAGFDHHLVKPVEPEEIEELFTRLRSNTA